MRSYTRTNIALVFVPCMLLAWAIFGYSFSPQAESAATPTDFTYNSTTGADGSVQTYTVGKTGDYKLEVWGAEGGAGSSVTGGATSTPAGRGGYSVGVVTLNAGDVLNIYVGGQGPSGLSDAVLGGWNGGGGGGTKTGNYRHGGGGGATDIRINSTSLKARVIVAGGGGGGGGSGGTTCWGNGSAGGGMTGVTGGAACGRTGGGGGTQVAGGAGGIFATGDNDGIGGAGVFGVGGTGGNRSNNAFLPGGGGGGWYGGGGGVGGGSGGGGGSGWVYTEAMLLAWSASNPTDASGWLLSSSYYLDSASTVQGVSTITEPDGSSAAGHGGNGYVRITPICTDVCVESVTPTKGGVAGGTTVTVNGQGFAAGATVTFDYAGTAVACTNVVVAADGKSLTCNTGAHVSGSVGVKVQNPTVPQITEFSCTGAAQPWTVPYTGQYKLEVWGAQGGDNTVGGANNVNGGKGGYSAGWLNLTAGGTLQVNVGCQGQTTAGGSYAPGGWNGGGSGGKYSSLPTGGGGGATDVRINNTSLKARVIVAGGGGGAGSNHGVGTTTDTGGAGGGTNGVNGKDSSAYFGYGATQTAGGDTGSDNRRDSVNAPGIFGLGGSMLTGSQTGNTTGGGGGGGWYGGGAGVWEGGGGGSGWIYTASTYSTWAAGNATDASGWLLNSSYYLTGANTVAGNVINGIPNPTTGTMQTGNAGNGYARVTAPAVSAEYGTCDNCFLYTETYIELTLTEINVSLSMTSSIPYNYGSTGVRTTTNNPTGYKLYAAATGNIDVANPQDLVCEDDLSTRFTPTTAGAVMNKGWGWQLGATVNSSAWATPTVANQPVFNSGTASGPAHNGATYDSTNFWVGARTDGSLKACVYTGAVTITAVPNM